MVFTKRPAHLLLPAHHPLFNPISYLLHNCTCSTNVSPFQNPPARRLTRPSCPLVRTPATAVQPGNQIERQSSMYLKAAGRALVDRFISCNGHPFALLISACELCQAQRLTTSTTLTFECGVTNPITYSTLTQQHLNVSLLHTLTVTQQHPNVSLLHTLTVS